MKRFPEVTLPFFRLPPLKQTRWNRHRLSVCWPLSARANCPRSLHVNKAHLPERPGDATPRQLLPSPHQGAPNPRPGSFLSLQSPQHRPPSNPGPRQVSKAAGQYLLASAKIPQVQTRRVSSTTTQPLQRLARLQVPARRS